MSKKSNTEHVMTKEEQQLLLFKRLQFVAMAFLLLTFVLYTVQKGLSYGIEKHQITLFNEEQLELIRSDGVNESPTCLLLWQDDLQGESARDLMEDVLSQMKVPFTDMKAEPMNADTLAQYQTIVLAVSDLSILGQTTLDLMDWTENGGGLMFLLLPWKNNFLDAISPDIGIVGMGSQFTVVRGIKFPRSFLLGDCIGEIGITDPYDSSIPVLLDDSCDVYLESTGTSPVPLFWRKSLGDGTVVVSNLGFIDTAYRGFYGSLFSLLGDGFAWPVINGSTFYIDDFPSPIPEGDSEYITRDFGMNVRDFMMQVWWPDVQKLAREHNIPYTGLVIENYSDLTKAPFPANIDINRFRYFGNDLLNMGGEIGFHGYNHMPLVMTNFDYQGDYDSYVKWSSLSDMTSSLNELKRFCSSLFPNCKFQVYVPPSNILSDEGRKLIEEADPDIKVIASTYIEGGVCYDQEFKVADDGIVETPRIISGYIMTDYTYLAAIAELNFHYVNTHFQHPDDVMDEDRGAALGWTEMCNRLDAYMDWLYTSVPNIRNLTGSELAAAVQRYDAATVEQVWEADKVTLNIGNFIDEVWLMLRLNEGQIPGDIDGGMIEELQDGLYLVRADKDTVEIRLTSGK